MAREDQELARLFCAAEVKRNYVPMVEAEFDGYVREWWRVRP